MSLYCSPSLYAASSDIIEKYLLSLFSRDILFTMIAPTVVITSFWMVLEIYVTFLDAIFKWCCSVWSPLSIRNSNSAWKFPETLAFCGSPSRGPLRAMLFLPLRINVVNRDLRISQCLLIYRWRKLLICWSIGHVRYINILTWLRGFRVKIANFFKFLLYTLFFYKNV